MSDSEGMIAPAIGQRLQRRKQRADALTAAKRRRFLAVLAATCNVRRAAAAAGAYESSFYNLRKRDAAFAAAWREALSTGYEQLEGALLAYALDTLEAISPADDVETIESDLGTNEDGLGLAEKVSVTQAQFALALLNRHRTERSGTAGRSVKRRATREETNAVLNRHLDSIARQIGVIE